MLLECPQALHRGMKIAAAEEQLTWQEVCFVAFEEFLQRRGMWPHTVADVVEPQVSDVIENDDAHQSSPSQGLPGRRRMKRTPYDSGPSVTSGQTIGGISAYDTILS
jgi:hypothetical protein